MVSYTSKLSYQLWPKAIRGSRLWLTQKRTICVVTWQKCLNYSVWYRKIVRNGWRYQQWTDKSGWCDWSCQSNRHTDCPSPYADASQLPRPGCWGFTRLRFWRNQWGWRDVVMRVLWLANKQVSPKRKWIECNRDKCMLTLTRAHTMKFHI